MGLGERAEGLGLHVQGLGFTEKSLRVGCSVRGG